MTKREPWEEAVGFLPWKVTVYEEPTRNWTLYLRWRQDGNWRKKSLQRPLRTPRGKIDLETKRWALTEAQDQYNALVRGVREEAEEAAPPMSIAEGLKAVTNPKEGKYPTDTMHRREVEREMKRAIAEWGANTPWESIKRKDIRRLWRRRIHELRAEGNEGLRGAEVTMQRVFAVASWLRNEESIAAGACASWKTWKDELRTDWIELTGARALPDVSRPRHTLEEMRKIMAVAGQVDPRLELALALGAELRIGQVIRSRRSDLNLEHKTFTVRGKGKKKGEVVMLTDGQMRVVEHHLKTGFLRDLERKAADYCLFPAGQLRGGRTMKDPLATVKYQLRAEPIDRSVIDGWFHDAEDLAEVPKVKGRAAYGLRRQSVDAAKAANISREGLQRLGGWTDTQVPDAIYADQEAEYARVEARDVRAKLRGETNDNGGTE
jgi:integrase